MSAGVLGQLLPIALVVLLLFVMVIRPARRRAQRVSKLQAALSAGDEVMLTSGIFGAVVSVEGDRVRVTVADDVVLTMHRGAIAEILRDVPGDDDKAVDADPADTDPDTDSDADPSHGSTTRGAS